MWLIWGRGEVCTGFWLGNLRERDQWGDPDVDGRIILRWIFRKWEGVVGTGCSWLRIGRGGGRLWVRWGTFEFRKCGESLLDFRHSKGGRSSAKRTGRLYPRRNPSYSFSEAESTAGHMVLSEGNTEKIASDTTGDRSRDRLTSSAAP